MNRQTSDAPLDFEQLVRDHGGRIRRIARRFAGDGAVDDLVQDILTRLWRSFAGFRGDAKVESWVADPGESRFAVAV
jgi:DNA-directed RNA polymerase specialized sigma24 family protein